MLQAGIKLVVRWEIGGERVIRRKYMRYVSRLGYPFFAEVIACGGEAV